MAALGEDEIGEAVAIEIAYAHVGGGCGLILEQEDAIEGAERRLGRRGGEGRKSKKTAEDFHVGTQMTGSIPRGRDRGGTVQLRGNSLVVAVVTEPHVCIGTKANRIPGKNCVNRISVDWRSDILRHAWS